MTDAPLDIGKHLAGVRFVPAPIEVLCYDTELDDEIAGQVLWLNLAALFVPYADQCLLIVAHDDPGIRAADEVTAGFHWKSQSFCCHVELPVLE